MRHKLRRVFRALVFASVFAAAGAYSQNSGTVFLVRHAEKVSSAKDALLSAQGRKRAECLARTLDEAGIGAIFTSEFMRTQQTAQPLAKKLNLKLTIVGADDIPGLVQKLREHSSEAALVVGHSDTVPDILEALGAGKVAAIKDDEFDQLFIFHSTGPKNGSVVTLKYCMCL